MINGQAISEVAKIHGDTHHFTLQALQTPHTITIYAFLGFKGIWIGTRKAIY